MKYFDIIIMPLTRFYQEKATHTSHSITAYLEYRHYSSIPVSYDPGYSTYDFKFTNSSGKLEVLYNLPKVAGHLFPRSQYNGFVYINLAMKYSIFFNVLNLEPYHGYSKKCDLTTKSPRTARSYPWVNDFCGKAKNNIKNILTVSFVNESLLISECCRTIFEPVFIYESIIISYSFITIEEYGKGFHIKYSFMENELTPIKADLGDGYACVGKKSLSLI